MLLNSSLLQLPRLCTFVDEVRSVLLSGVGPYIDRYSLSLDDHSSGPLSRLAVFEPCGRPVTAIASVDGNDSFVVTGSSLIAVLSWNEIETGGVLPSSRVHSFNDEIVRIAYAKQIDNIQEIDIGIILRSGRTLRVRASIKSDRLLITTVTENDRARCGLLMSALVVGGRSWDSMWCVAGSAMGEVYQWKAASEAGSRKDSAGGFIGFVIAMVTVDESAERSTVVAVTENRAVNLWRIRNGPDSKWLEVIDHVEAAHAVRPSGVTFISEKSVAISSAEDGELCLWSVSPSSLTILRRFQTRVGAIRTLAATTDMVFYGSATGSYIGLPVDSILSEPDELVITGIDPSRPSSSSAPYPPPIRHFVIRATGQTLSPQSIMCLGEDGSLFEIDYRSLRAGETAFAGAGSFLHLTSWNNDSTSVIVAHSSTRVMVFADLENGSFYRNLESATVPAASYRILSVRPTVTRAQDSAAVMLMIQTCEGQIAIIEISAHAATRMWRFKVADLRAADTSTRGKKRSEMLIANSFAIDRSTESTVAILGTTNGRLLWARLSDAPELIEEAENVLDRALGATSTDGAQFELYPPSPRLQKTSITQLEYLSSSCECVCLSKNGIMMRARIDNDGGLVVSEEELSRESSVEWPIRLERRGHDEYVVGFNERNLLIVSRSHKTRLLSIDCGGGHRAVAVQMRGGGGRGGVEDVVVHYVTQGTISRHAARSTTAGMRPYAYTPHRDKIVFCRGSDAFLLTGSIDGEIVFSSVRDHSAPPRILQRWFVPEVTSCALGPAQDGHMCLAIGGPKGDVYVVRVNIDEDTVRQQALHAIPTENKTRIIDVAMAGDDCVAVAFADAQIVIFRLDAHLRSRPVFTWNSPPKRLCMYTKIYLRRVGDQSLLKLDAISSGGMYLKLSIDEETMEVTSTEDWLIDKAALTAIARSGEITVIGSDSGSIFVFRDGSQEPIARMRDVHVTQITDIAIDDSRPDRLSIVTVGMDCALNVLRFEEDKLTTHEHSAIFAVNDPSSVHILRRTSAEEVEGTANVDSTTSVIVAGSGVQVVSW